MSTANTTGYPANLCTTLRLLRTAGACTDGYKKLLRHIRDQYAATPEDFGMDCPIAIAEILESNGQDDAIWSLRATIDSSEKFTRLLACDFAERTLPIFEKKYPDDKRLRAVIDAARKFAKGEISREELRKARAAAAVAAAAAAAVAAAAVAVAVADDAVAAAAVAAAASDYVAYDAYAESAAYAAYAVASDAVTAAAYAASAVASDAVTAAAYAAYAASAYAATRLTEKQWQLGRFKEVLNAEKSGDTPAESKGESMGCAA